jgi:hypothetical protein
MSRFRVRNYGDITLEHESDYKIIACVILKTIKSNEFVTLSKKLLIGYRSAWAPGNIDPVILSDSDICTKMLLHAQNQADQPLLRKVLSAFLL